MRKLVIAGLLTAAMGLVFLGGTKNADAYEGPGATIGAGRWAASKIAVSRPLKCAAMRSGGMADPARQILAIKGVCRSNRVPYEGPSLISGNRQL